MIIETFASLAGTLAGVLSGLLPWASDSEGSGYLILLGPAAGVGYYMYFYLRYRNTNKRHALERETKSAMSNLGVSDVLVDRVYGTENSRISGDNARSPRERLGQGSSYTES